MITSIINTLALAVFAAFYAYILNVSSKEVAPIDSRKHPFLSRLKQLYCPATFTEVAARFAMEILICGILLDAGHIFTDDTAVILLAIPVLRLLMISLIRAIVVSRASKLNCFTK